MRVDENWSQFDDGHFKSCKFHLRLVKFGVGFHRCTNSISVFVWFSALEKVGWIGNVLFDDEPLFKKIV